MTGRLLNPRLWLGVISFALIGVALYQMIDIRTPNRPWGDASEIRRLSERSDLNVVFVLIDTLRADRLGSYGYERETSPILDAMAETGVRFDNVLAQSTWTKTSMASIWTGAYPTRHGITRYMDALPESLETPAERMRDAGFQTIGIFRNGWVAQNFGFSQGFDLYYEPVNTHRPPNLAQQNPSMHKLRGNDGDATWAAVEFLRTAGSQRFLLYMHMMDVHQYVYDDSADFGTTFSDIYDNSIHWVDENLGTLIAVLQQENLMENTLIVIASDHGEAFFEHGDEGHGRDLYSENTRVPLIMILPYRLREPLVVETPVENVDIWPTILDLVGLPPMEDVDGRSLVPIIEATARGEQLEEPERRRFAYLDRHWGKRQLEPQPLEAVEDGRYKLIRQSAPDRLQMFDLENDPTEQTNISESFPEVAARLGRDLDQTAAVEEPSWGAPEEVEIDDMQLGQLRALGYVIDAEDLKENERNRALLRRQAEEAAAKGEDAAVAVADESAAPGRNGSPEGD